VDAPLRGSRERETRTAHDVISRGEADPCFSRLWMKETLESIDPRVRAFFAGAKTQGEIARERGCTKSNVSRMVNRERKRLREALSKEE
jgi:DNA-directed RNA polymerase specialized sigma24 family protein